MVSKGKMTQDNECQGQRQKTREADLRDTFDLSFFFFFLNQKPLCGQEGKIADASFSFTSFTEFSGFD